jgi:hypothetical protein
LGSASESEREVSLPIFGPTLQTRPKTFTITEIPWVGPKTSVIDVRNLTFNAQAKLKSKMELARRELVRKSNNFEAIRNKLQKCLHGDSLLKSSMNWRDWVTKTFTYCKLCLKNFKIEEEHSALVHLAVVHKLYVCNQCNLVCKSSYVLVTHMQDAHKIPKQHLVCVLCKYLFINKTERDKHIDKIHTWTKYLNQSTKLIILKGELQKKSTVPSILRRKR